jgi:molybdopterin synthase catalytic subunit
MVEGWIREIKSHADFRDLGMFLVHHGVVRSTAKDGRPVKGMQLSYDKKKLSDLVDELSGRDGVSAIKVWINEGMLGVGDEIMYALVAGRFRTHVFPVLEELVSRIKKEIVSEAENF